MFDNYKVWHNLQGRLLRVHNPCRRQLDPLDLAPMELYGEAWCFFWSGRNRCDMIESFPGKIPAFADCHHRAGHPIAQQ
jgi:hypothetical protein